MPVYLASTRSVFFDLKVFFEPEIQAAQFGDVGAQAHHEEKFGEDDGCYWDDRKGITHCGVVVEDFVGDEGDGGGADAESDEIYNEQIKRSGLAAHGVGDELDNRSGDQAGGHAAEENCDVEKWDHGVRLRHEREENAGDEPRGRCKYGDAHVGVAVAAFCRSEERRVGK